MTNARASISLALLLTIGSCVADGATQKGPTGIDEIRVGILDHYGNSEGVIEAPNTVARGEAFSVTITTYGGGCEEAHSLQAEMVGSASLLVPYDRTFLPPDDEMSDPPVAEACTSQLRRFPRDTTLQFDEPGERQIRVRGRRVADGVDEEIELVHNLLVQ